MTETQKTKKILHVSLIKMLRVYAVLRRFGYLDPLIYSLDPNVIKDTLTQATREYLSYMQSAVEKDVNIYNRKTGGAVKAKIPCLAILKQSDIKELFVRGYKDVVHEIVNGGSSHEKEYCISPVVFSKNGNIRVSAPSEFELKSFMNELNKNIYVARELVELAMGGS